MSHASTANDWTKPAAAAIPKEGYFTLEQGGYGPDVSTDADHDQSVTG